MSSSDVFHRGRVRLVVLFMLAGLAGCTKYYLLLDEDEIKRMNYSHDKEHRIVYFNKTFSYTPEGKLLEKTHEIIRIGDNPITHIPALYVSDESFRTLTSVEGRVLHIDGSSEKFSRDDFYSFNVSSSEVISDEKMKSAFIEKKLKPGDLIETASIHELIYPQLGFGFSLSELEYSAENITCCIESNSSDSIRYRVVNSDVAPSIVDSTTRKIIFHWDSYRETKRRRGVMEKRNQSPTVVGVRLSQTWQSYGDWYLHFIAPQLRPDSAFVDSALRITAGTRSSKEKMDAIFDYCQRNVRYEQVYLKQGAFLPNDVNETLAHKYGDCKDYSCLMYAMAVSVGVRPQLALCYRGRGVEFYDDMPTSQFNHAILHLTDGGRDYWYDGTDRAGIPGITSFDLSNGKVLILEEGRSRLSVIEDVPGNMLAITGIFSVKGINDVKGELNAAFSNQYAVDLFWLEHRKNKEDLSAVLKQIVKETMNENIQIDSLRWYSKDGKFNLSMICELPNCVTLLQQKSWTSVSRLFPELLPHDLENEKQKGVFYFPSYNRVSVNVAISVNGRPAAVQMEFHLPAGPFTDSTRAGFLSQLQSANEDFKKIYSISEVSNQ